MSFAADDHTNAGHIHTHVCIPLDIQHEDSRFSSDVVKAFEKYKSSIDRCEVNQHTVSEDTMDTSETYLLTCPLELETDIETRVRLARVQSLFLAPFTLTVQDLFKQTAGRDLPEARYLSPLRGRPLEGVPVLASGPPHQTPQGRPADR